IASVSSDGILHVRGTANSDTIVISHVGDSFVVHVNEQTKHIPSFGVQSISANGRRGDDRLEMHAGMTSTLVGGDGNDTLVGGAGPDDLVADLGSNEFDPDTIDDVIS